MNIGYQLKAVVSLLALFPGLLFFSPLQEPVSYSRVDAIFQNKCVACHGHTSRTSGLSLESFDALMNGGMRGAPVVPGKSGESLLVKYIDGTLKPRMPLGDQLGAEEISAIKAWIDAGAKGPGGAASLPAELAKSERPDKTAVPDIKPAVPVKAAISSLAFQPGGAVIALGGYRDVELIGKDGRTIAKLEGHASQVRGLAFSPDGRLLAAAGGNPGQFGEIKIWSVEERKEVQSIRGHRDNIFAVVFSPDGKMLATCSYDRMVKLWDVATGKEIRNLKDHTDAVFAVAFSPDGHLLASASADRTVKIWNVATGERLYTLGDGLDAMNAIAFHPSGRMLAGAGADRVLRVWEVGEKEGRQLRSLIAHEDAINQVVYSPDGKTIASTGADKVIKLWDATAPTLTEIRELERQPDWVFAMAYAPDGKNLAVGRYDGSAAMYDLAGDKGVALK
ncbi:MAG TPA: c-type cytochrome domain-containing protein [Blastocatellia bacterium]|nr:c-type cytochrome domain-containing protein [Blastocatellia bacterium]